MRVATFNVHHCEGRDGVLDVARVADAITATKASLVALQELDQGMERSGRVDQPRMLQELTGMAVSFFPTLRRGGGRFGVGIASDGPIEAEFRRLPHQGGLEPRGVIVARWSGISVVAAHLSTEPEARARQTQALAETAAALPPPTVVMGDLNQRLTALKPLLDLGFSCPAHPQHTFGRRFAKRQIDFVLAGPGLKVSEWTSLRSAASDHLPLAATLQPV